MRTRVSVLSLLLIGSFIAVSATAQAPQVAFKCKDVKVKNALETDSYGVNNAGVIAGDYVDASGIQHGMLLAGKKLTSFDGPDGSSGIAAYGVNNSNVAAGWYIDSNGLAQGFTFDGTTVTTVSAPKGVNGTEINGINDNGWLTGIYFDAASVQHGFYFDGKKFHKYDVKNSSGYVTELWAVNNSNVMTLYTLDPSSGLPVDGYTLTGKKLAKFDPPDSANTAIHGINNNGDLDFTIFDASQNRHGVLYQAATSTYTTFDDPKGKNSTRADALNDTDVQVGRYSPTSGNPPNAGFVCTVQ